MTDQQLIDLYFARDEGAVAETERKYGAYCRAIARRLLADSRGADSFPPADRGGRGAGGEPVLRGL